MASITTSYPSSSTVGLTITLASLASDTNLLAGRASTAVDNSSNLDLDHLVSGSVTMHASTTPTAGSAVEVWAYAPRSLSSGTATYPDSITGTDANKSMTSANVKNAALRLVASFVVDATTSRVYDVPPTSIAQLFGGAVPYKWGLFVVHGTGAALSAGAFQYQRIQNQVA